MWIEKVERILQTHKPHNLINKSIPRPMRNNPDGQKWKTLSKQATSWLGNRLGRDLLHEVYARGDRTGFADEFMEELKKHMEGERHVLNKGAVPQCSQMPVSKIVRPQRSNTTIMCFAIMFSGLMEVPELETFILAKRNELDAVRNPVEDITSTDFYRYSRAIWNYIIPMNAESQTSFTQRS
ncbi:hypothetical protein PCH_Pc13g10880 [Penicillium rubens Wisconsin 54-1255]|uniref:Uncharacterized protein n=1 Tax=Penicillium rubens (strain ATCC 28089 / DSM 1075 / NRRL 1951 / Wisconsin 54-1255) TaxID=500485 RepID=B6H3W0_PENRW|nr:hypothetical protein PCH_Pc13g10880 [Penicillium rubens Wisconsin 54-1255]